MSRINWTEELEIGIAVIDGQHRRIVDYINTLHELDEEANRDVVGRVIGDLIDYTYSHFAFEEELMEEAGYEYLAVHRKTHLSFRDRVDELKRQFDEGNEVASDLAELLKTWLLRHIMSDDSSYAPLVKERLARIESRNQGNWLSSTVCRFFGR